MKIAVAVRDGDDLFLCHRIRRSPTGEIFHMTVTGREDEREWKKWNPHESLHKDGTYHVKIFDKKHFTQKRQVPDSDFSNTESFPTQGLASHEPRARGVPCELVEFDAAMEIPVELLSAKQYETYLAIDLTEPDGPPILPNGSQILAQRRFDDAVPEILVTVFAFNPTAQARSQ